MTLGLVLLIAFIFWERQTQYPMFPRCLFANKVVRKGSLLIVENISIDIDHHRSFRGQLLVSGSFLAFRVSGAIWSRCYESCALRSSVPLLNLAGDDSGELGHLCVSRSKQGASDALQLVIPLIAS